jgi:hypothetical protein
MPLAIANADNVPARRRFMPAKSPASKAPPVDRINEGGVLLHELIVRGLAANDRLEYYISLLQAAEAHAVAPHRPTPTLRMQREASGVDNASLDHVVEGSLDRGGNVVYIPHACAIVESLFEDLREMLQPLRVAGAGQPELRSRVDVYQRRLDSLLAHAPACFDDQLTAGTIRTLARLSGNSHDTLHQLVIDLHWELNRLQTSVAMEMIDGARVYHLLPSERALVCAFMRGINETAALKFDHPGLSTTATHEQDRLAIHNDLGMTQGHLIVIHVAGLSATLTYTDVHHARVAFLEDMLRPFDVEWTRSTAAGGAGVEHEIAVGRFTADGPDRLEGYLTFLGSRLVFLIDWNRARKRLARLVGKADAIALLKWAAENNVGHVGFLKAGDVRLVEAALERTSPLRKPPGGRLDEWLGRDAARSFLMTVLHATATGVRAGLSPALVEEQIDAELLKHVQTADHHVFGEAADHAVMIAALTDRIRRTLIPRTDGEAHEESARSADLTHAWDDRAEGIVRHAGRRDLGADDSRELRPLWRDADRAADAIEETAFLLTLLPTTIGPKARSLLGSLADIVGLSVREYARCLDESRQLSASSHRSEVDSFLLTVDRLVDLGRQARTAKRLITEGLLHGQGDFHELYLVASIASGFERAAIALSRCGPVVRDYVLSTWLKR